MTKQYSVKQTAGNTTFLRTVKTRFNAKVLRSVSDALNERGPEAALVAIGRMYNAEHRPAALVEYSTLLFNDGLID